ncbi:MAG: ATP-binding protein [Planctomycetota bacterium]
MEDWGKVLGDVPAASAILDRFLRSAEIVTCQGRSYRLKDSRRPRQPFGAVSGFTFVTARQIAARLQPDLCPRGSE